MGRYTISAVYISVISAVTYASQLSWAILLLVVSFLITGILKNNRFNETINPKGASTYIKSVICMIAFNISGLTGAICLAIILTLLIRKSKKLQDA